MPTTQVPLEHIEMQKPRQNLLFFYLLVFNLILILYQCILLGADVWKEDLTSAMKIGLSTTGYKSVDLTCGNDNFSVNVTVDENFEGVIYTRGSFNNKKPPCFKRHNQYLQKNTKSTIIDLRIPFDKCKTVMDVAESRYTNTLVIQHDPDLIMPGDAAFSLDCTFTPEYKDSTIVSTELNFKSKISLVSADPAEQEPQKSNEYIVTSKSEKVSFKPEKTKDKDEL